MTEPNGPSQKRYGSPMAVVIISLMLGAGVFLLLLVLRTNERGGSPVSSISTKPAAALSADAAKLNILKREAHEIQSWITSRMAKTNARIGVVNIWATWCEPCRDEMPELARFQKSGGAPLFLISADNEIDEPIVRSFLAEKGVDFESSLIKGDQQVFIEQWQRVSAKDPAKQWSMTLPATFLVNAAGRVISFRVGTTTATELAALVKNSLDQGLDTAHD